MKNIFKSLILALVFYLTLASCSTMKGPSTLNNNHWKLQELNGTDIYLAFNIKRDIFIEFKDTVLNDTTKRFIGYTGCNRIFGGYTVKESKLHFSDIGATRMACPQMRAENQYLRALSQVDNYKIDGNKLSLYQGSELLVTYKK